jgi:type VI secretion system secreted protein Hcp
MALDAYLQLGDIKGDSTDDKHKGWIEVQNVDWGVTQPRATAISTAGGHTSGKADVHEVSFDKLADIASPILFQTCAMGKTIPKAKFEFFRADGDGTRIKYFEIELENVMLSNFHPNSGNSGLINERRKSTARRGMKAVTLGYVASRSGTASVFGSHKTLPMSAILAGGNRVTGLLTSPGRSSRAPL